RRRTAERWRRRPWRATSPCQRCAGPRAYRAAAAPDTNAALDIEVAADLGDTAGSEGMFAAIGAPAGRNGMARASRKHGAADRQGQSGAFIGVAEATLHLAAQRQDVGSQSGRLALEQVDPGNVETAEPQIAALVRSHEPDRSTLGGKTFGRAETGECVSAVGRADHHLVVASGRHPLADSDRPGMGGPRRLAPCPGTRPTVPARSTPVP